LKRNAQELLAIADSLRRLYEKQNQVITHFTEYTEDFARLNTPEMATQFASLDLARRKQRALDLVIETVDEHLDGLRDLDASQLVAAVEQKVHSVGHDVGEWWQKDAKAHIGYEARIAEAGGTHTQTVSAITVLREAIAGLRGDFIAQSNRIEETIRQGLSADTRAQVEANQRSQAENRLAAAKKAREDYLGEFEKYKQKTVERQQIVAQLSAKQLEISGARSTQRDALVAKLNGFRTEKFAISVDFRSGGDRSALVDFLAASKGFLSSLGVQPKARKWPELLSNALTPCQLGEKLWNGDAESLAMKTEIDGQMRSITPEEAKCIVEKRQPLSKHDGADVFFVDKTRLEQILQLECIAWDDLVQITLNGQAVESLSPGQRSSAMLPLIALSESTPLLIDQPEDNLDIRLVGEVVAGILASLKEHRQVIAATHNSNIVVLGDAEQVIVLDAIDNRQGRVIDRGSIDVPSIVQHVVALLEGGKDAFCVRKERYEL
jgi:hypothetical protein